MKILFTTTVDQTFSKTNLIKAWLAWFFYSTIGTYNDTSLELYISIGCMSLTDGKPLSRGGFQVLNGEQLKCTYLHNLLSPPYRAEHSKHLKLFSISHPDVRKMMLIYGFAATRKYDMIVYSDLDAFHIKNPLPELLTLKNTTNNNYYAAAFARHEYNISEVCQGFFAIFDMQLPQYWLSQGIFAQNEINDWLNGTLNIIGNPTFHQELRLPIRVPNNKHIYIKLLAEPDYFRGACKDNVTENMKIFHCHSMYNHVRKKEKDLSKASRLSPLDSSLIKKLLEEAVSMQTETQSVSLRYGRRFRFRGKREKVLPANYAITLNAQRLNLNPHLHQLFNGDKKWQELYKKFYPSM